MNINWEIWEYINYDDWVNIGISLLILFALMVFGKLFSKYIFYYILKVAKKGKTDFLKQILEAYERPLSWLFIIIGIYIAAEPFPYIDQENQLFEHIIRSSVVVLVAWGIYNLSSTSSLLFMKLNDGIGFDLDQILIPFLSKTLRFVIIAITLSIIAEEFGYPISGFVAGLGLGGLAFALAAQEVLKNFFGGVVIITEKPFTLGEWIKTPSVEGTVEDINFRSTSVRTFAQALVTVPNSTLASEPITNWSKMGKRRITFNLGVEYGTPKAKIESVLERIRDLLKNHEEIHQETIFVTFDKYNDSSLDLFLYFFTKTTEWGKYLEVKEEINFKILDILDEEGVSVAFPSHTIYMGNGDEESSQQQDTSSD